MLDIKFIRENPDAVRENIKKKFQDAKLPLVDEVLDLDAKRRAAIAEADQLRSNRNQLSKQIGMLMGQAKKDPSKLQEAEAVKAQVKEQADRLAELLAGQPGHVNLIPLNDVAESPLKPSRRVREFQRRLERHGITVTVRRRLGSDIDASCGQLRRKQMLQKSEH